MYQWRLTKAETPVYANETKKRRQYSREKKLETVTYYYETAKENEYRASQRFGIDMKCLQTDGLRRKKQSVKRLGEQSRLVVEGEHFGQTGRQATGRSCSEKA